MPKTMMESTPSPYLVTEAGAAVPQLLSYSREGVLELTEPRTDQGAEPWKFLGQREPPGAPMQVKMVAVGAGKWSPRLLPQQLKAPCGVQYADRLVEEARRLLTARTRLRRSSNFSSASRSFCTSSKRLISSAANFSGSTWISFGIRYVRWREKHTRG